MVLLIQEPWSVGGNVCGLGSASNRIIVGSSANETPWAAIVVTDRSLDVVAISHLSTLHCVCVHITTRFGEMYVVFLYCQPSLRIAPFIHQLRKINSNLKGAPVL